MDTLFTMENVSVRVLTLPELLAEYLHSRNNDPLKNPLDHRDENHVKKAFRLPIVSLSAPSSAKIGKIADYNAHEPTNPKTIRYRYIHRTLRRQTEKTAGKSRIDSRRIGATERNSEKYAVQLGRGKAFAVNRTISTTCRSPRNQGSDALAGVLKKEFSTKLPDWVYPLLTSTQSGIILCLVTLGTVHGDARHNTESKNTSQNLLPRRDNRMVRTDSLFVNNVEVTL